MKLYFKEFAQHPSLPPLVLLHGLLGSLVNWQRIARELSDQYRVIVPDLRNHGRSPHASDVSYIGMAGDVLELLDDLDLESAAVVGHSMGGKTAMLMALQYPQRIERLGVVDIAPVSYSGSLGLLLDALLALPLEEIENRRDADRILAQSVPDKAVRDHMLQNLRRTEDGWKWRNNLLALRQGLAHISGFPVLNEGDCYQGKTVFIKGALSDYIKPSYQPQIEKLFPAATLVEIANAGHWVYAQQPKAFLDALREFL